MEPVAIYLNYWNWEGDVIPLQNYVAWFLIAFFFASIFSYLKIEIKGKIFAHYFLIQFFFFVILNLVIT
jgi:putative membrane protein